LTREQPQHQLSQDSNSNSNSNSNNNNSNSNSSPNVNGSPIQNDPVGLCSSDVNRASNSSADEDSSEICKVCFDAKINCVLVPCGHFSICMKCAIPLSSCPVCRSKIEQRQVVFRA